MKILILCTGLLLAAYVKTHGQSATPPKDTILKQLRTDLKTEAWNVQRSTFNVQQGDIERIPGRVDEKATQHFNAGDFDLALFGSGSIDIRSRSKEDIDFAGGIGATYWFTRGFGLGGYGALGDFDHSVFDLASGRVTVRAPLWDHIAPYGYADGGYNFEAERWQIGAGGGLEFRVSRGWGFFVEAGLGTTTRGASYGSARSGLNLKLF